MGAATVSTHTIAGRTFRCSERTAAHLTHTIAKLKAAHPKARLVIIQPSYNTTVAASAGTHDKDAVFDFRIDNLDWWAAQRFLRTHGWACWFRHQGIWSNPASYHIHAISLGYVAPVGVYVPGQVQDYYNHAFGLKDMHRPGSDTSWFPPDIKATIFDYNAYQARVAAAQPTYYDIRVALGRLEVASKNEKAKPVYRRAASIVGKLVPDARRVRVPETTSQVIAALAYKHEHSRNYWTKYRLTVCIRILRPLA